MTDAQEVISNTHDNRVQGPGPTAHAEIEALRADSRRTNYLDTTPYTTVAPCALCAGAIVLFKILRVVIGTADPFAGEAQ